MKKVICLTSIFLLCSCSNINSSNTDLNIDESQFLEEIELFNYSNNHDAKNEYIANLEANIIDEAKILPINTSNSKILTYVLKTNNNPIIINGKNYYRLKDSVIFDNIVTDEMIKDINNYCYKNNITYKKYCENNNLTVNNQYTVPFSFNKIESLNYYDFKNSLQNEVLLQCFDSLIEIDMFGNVVTSMAKSYEISEDKLTYTFTLKDDLYFITSDGNIHSNITAKSFVDGFKYMLDLNIYNDTYKNIVNVKEYIKNNVSFDDVGFKAINDTTLSITLDNPDHDFTYKLANNIIIPLDLSYFENKGGRLYPSFTHSGNYGKISSLSNSLYCGPYYPTLINNEKIILTKNKYYYNKNVSIDNINYIKDETDLIDKFYSKKYSEIQINDDKLVDNNLLNVKYNDSSIRYVLLNSKRENFEVYNSYIKTSKTEQEIQTCKEALNNINFRRAILSCIDTSLFSINNKPITSLSLYDHPIIVDNKSISYNDYLESLTKNRVNHDLNKAKQYYQLYKEEINNTSKIILDVICYINDDSMVNNINSIKATIEDTLGKENVYINIIYCNELYGYFLAGHQKYQCYDLYFDFTVNIDYNSRYRYIKEIMIYI